MDKQSGTVPDFNEFVWIPVSDMNNFKRTSWIVSSGYTEPEGPGMINYEISVNSFSYGDLQPLSEEPMEDYFWENKTTTEYENMIESVKDNKGFYIARYESDKGKDNLAQSKRRQEVWINLTQTMAISASKNTSINNNMHLIYGIEWDYVQNWLIGNAIIPSSINGETKTLELEDVQDSSLSWGYYDESVGDAILDGDNGLIGSGMSEYWKANNIYDLAGNYSEWTQEKYSTNNYGVVRGGILDVNGGNGPSSTRGTLKEDHGGMYGFRISFYI